MKTRILASLIIGGVLATSVAQADTAFPTRDLDVIYSGFNPSFTRDVDVSNYYMTLANLQKVAANEKSTCDWRAVKTDRNSINGGYTAENSVENIYLPSRNVQLVCSRTPANLQKVAANENKSTCHWRAVKNDPNSINGAYHAEYSVENYYQTSRYMQRVC